MEAETNKLRPLELGKAFEFDLTNNTLTPVKSMFEDDNSINNTVTAADRMNQYIDKCESLGTAPSCNNRGSSRTAGSSSGGSWELGSRQEA